MEADLHAIVRPSLLTLNLTQIVSNTDQVRSTAVGRTFPVVHLSDPLWSQSESCRPVIRTWYSPARSTSILHESCIEISSLGTSSYVVNYLTRV